MESRTRGVTERKDCATNAWEQERPWCGDRNAKSAWRSGHLVAVRGDGHRRGVVRDPRILPAAFSFPRISTQLDDVRRIRRHADPFVLRGLVPRRQDRASILRREETPGEKTSLGHRPRGPKRWDPPGCSFPFERDSLRVGRGR